MAMRYWGSLDDDSSKLTSPYLLPFDEVEKLSKEIVPPSFSLGKHNKPESITTQMMPISYFECDPVTHHNIQLVQYLKQMQELIHQTQNSYIKMGVDSIPPVPLRQTKNPARPDLSIQLTRKGAQQILHKSIFHICAHEGFDRTSESIISILVDVAEEMLTKFCNLLKVNTERELLNQSTGFVDAMERTLHDFGMSGVKDLHSYHVNRVLRYNSRLKSQGEQLFRACVKAASQSESGKATSSLHWEESEWTEWSGNEGQESENPSRRESVKSRVDSGAPSSEAVNQLHLEDNISNLAPELEPGLRMLHTLEQQEASESNPSCLPHLVFMEEDSGSPTNFVGLDSASPSISGSGKNGNKKRRNV